MTYNGALIQESDPGAKGLNFKQGRKERLVFIVKKEQQLYAYDDKNLIQCSVHGALFNIETGDCMGGPCNGVGLTPAKIEVDSNGDVFLLA